MYEFKFSNNYRKGIILSKPLPLALRPNNRELEVNQQIELLNLTTGLLAYQMGIEYAFIKDRKVFYDSNSGEILNTIWAPQFKRKKNY